MRLRLILCSKRIKTIQTIKFTLNAILVFLCLESLRELFVFNGLGYVLKYKLEVFFFL